ERAADLRLPGARGVRRRHRGRRALRRDGARRGHRGARVDDQRPRRDEPTTRPGAGRVDQRPTDATGPGLKRTGLRVGRGALVTALAATAVRLLTVIGLLL